MWERRDSENLLLRMSLCFSFQERRQEPWVSSVATGTVPCLLTFSPFPIAPAKSFPWDSGHLALKGLGWLLQVSPFPLYFLMYLNTITLKYPMVLVLIFQISLEV